VKKEKTTIINMKRTRQQRKDWIKKIEDERVRKKWKIKIPLLDSDSDWIRRLFLLQNIKYCEEIKSSQQFWFFNKLNVICVWE
jgi:hypothetical protein